MRQPNRFWIGIALLALGTAAYLAVDSLLHGPAWKAVEMPIDLSTGTVSSPPFTPNIDATYQVRIEASTRGKLPARIVQCLLGTAPSAKECSQPPVLRVGWVLSSQDGMLAHGSTADQGCCRSAGSEGTTALVIGGFDAEKGRPFVLSLNVLEDGTALAAAGPRLIAESRVSKSQAAVFTLLQLLCGALAIFGLFTIISYVAAKGDGAEVSG